MILDPCTWVSEDFLLAIGGFPQEYHLRPSPGVLISSLEGAWVVLDGIVFCDVCGLRLQSIAPATKK